MREELTQAQATYLRELKLSAEVAASIFEAVLRGMALAAGDKGQVTYDLGPEPWIAVTAPDETT